MAVCCQEARRPWIDLRKLAALTALTRNSHSGRAARARAGSRTLVMATTNVRLSSFSLRARQSPKARVRGPPGREARRLRSRAHSATRRPSACAHSQWKKITTIRDISTCIRA